MDSPRDNRLRNYKTGAQYCGLEEDYFRNQHREGRGPEVHQAVTSARVFHHGSIGCLDANVEGGDAMSDLDRAIWTPVSIKPLLTLAALRDMVLVRSTKRMPKWKFRVAPDVVAQIQARPGNLAALFQCKAVVHDEAGADLFDGRRPLDSWMIEFNLFATPNGGAGFSDGGEWHIKPTCVGFRTGHPHNDIFMVRDRLIETMPAAFEKLRPEMMLKPACLFCGKQLTGPVSMARWIGPECAGTAAAISRTPST